MKKKNNIRASKFADISTSNKNKIYKLDEVLSIYNNLLVHYIDLYWNQYVGHNNYDIPIFSGIRKNDIANYHVMTIRFHELAANDALGKIRSVTEKKRRILWLLSKKPNDAKLKEKLKSFKLKKPIITKPSITLNSKFITLIENNYPEQENQYYLKLTSLSKQHNCVLLVDFHKHTRKLHESGKLKAIKYNGNRLDLIFEIKQEDNSSDKIIGVDQGMRTMLTLSDGQSTSTCKHGHSFSSICNGMTLKQKGSKRFKKAQAHRTNYIREQINKLDFTDISEIRFEDVSRIFYKRGRSMYLDRFVHSEIQTALRLRCEKENVSFILQPSMYRSQRCSSCGYVFKGNRNNKEYVCQDCGSAMDADLNAACNHAIDLCAIPDSVFRSGVNKTGGFFWQSDGIYSKDGRLWSNREALSMDFSTFCDLKSTNS